MPNRSSDRVEQKVLTARRRRKRGAVVLAAELGLNPSTVGRILARHQVPALKSTRSPARSCAVRGAAPTAMSTPPGSDGPCGRQKLGRIPAGGGWRLHGRDAAVSVAHRHKKIKVGYDYVHTAIDDYTRLAYSEVLPTRRTRPVRVSPPRHDLVRHPRCACAPAPDRQRHGLPPRHRLGASLFGLATTRRFTKPGCPWTNGKAERFNRTLLTEWAYARPWTSNSQRTRGLDQFLRRYNTQRGPLRPRRKPPISRLAAWGQRVRSRQLGCGYEPTNHVGSTQPCRC